MTISTYGDVEALLVYWLKTVVGLTNVVTEQPTNLQFVLPLHVVERFGGGDTGELGLDVANVDIDTFAADRTTAKNTAELVRWWLRMKLPGWRSLDGRTVVSRVETIQAPTNRPWDSRNAVRRFGGTYRIHLHTRL